MGLWALILIWCSTFSILVNVGLRLTLGFLTWSSLEGSRTLSGMVLDCVMPATRTNTYPRDALFSFFRIFVQTFSRHVKLKFVETILIIRSYLFLLFTWKIYFLLIILLLRYCRQNR